MKAEREFRRTRILEAEADPSPKEYLEANKAAVRGRRIDGIQQAATNSRDASTDDEEWPIPSGLPHNTTTDRGRENEGDQEWDDINARLLGRTTADNFIEHRQIIDGNVEA